MSIAVAIGLITVSNVIWLAGCEQNIELEDPATAAYVVVNFRITDTDAYSVYPPLARPTLAAHGADVLVIDRESEAIEGEPGHATAVIRFPSRDAARAWYYSPEYQEIVNLRLDNSEGIAVIASGVAPPN